MKETLRMSCARTVTLISFGSSGNNSRLLTITALTPRMTGAMKKCLGTPVQRAASSQTSLREAIIAGAIAAEPRCCSGRVMNAWHNAMAATRSLTVTRNTAGTVGTHGGPLQRVADCLCPTSLVEPRGGPGSGTADGSAMMPPKLPRHRRSGKRRRRRRRLIAVPRQRGQSRSQPGRSTSN